VRELGTLKAIGWTQRLVVRQVAGEAVTQGVLGGLLGLALGLLLAAIVTGFGPTLTASSNPAGGGSIFGIGGASLKVSRDVTLSAPISATVIVGGLAVAILGGLLAGAAGALRAARLRPADALRQYE
jgi:putative ABC transport system permease protein